MTDLPTGVSPLVTDWIASAVPDARPPLTVRPISGGRSNLTYRVSDTRGAAWVLRRPPLGHHAGGAHDVLREARLLRGLTGQVPVPAVIGECADESVTGAPFFVMQFVDGTIIRTRDDAARHLAPGRRADVGPALIDALIAIHRADPDPLGLGGLLGRRDYLQRQLDRWQQNWLATRTRASQPLEDAHRLLLRHIPDHGRVTVVHGDFRLDNCVLSPELDVRAILDWELATVGDPLADLGQFLVYWALPGDARRVLFDPPTALPGFTPRDVLTERYCAATDTDPARLDYYLAFNWWKIACIVENVYSRMVGGAMGSSDRDPQSFADQAADLAAHAVELARSLEVR